MLETLRNFPRSSLAVPTFVAVTVFLLFYFRSLARWRARSCGRPLPPGPKGLPIFGNAFNIPTYKPWVTYRDLSAVYGEIMHFRVLGQSIVVLGSPDVIFDFLEKRSANTSDRQTSIVMEMAGIYSSFAFQPYGPWWRRHRRAFWQFFHRDATMRYQPVQYAVTHRFLELILESPKEFVDHIRYTFAAAVLQILYGIHVADGTDQYVLMAEESMDAVANGLVAGKFLVELLPFLRYVPSWLPGAGWKRLFAKWRDSRYRAKTLPLEYVKREMDHEDVRDSVVGQLLTEISNSPSIQDDDEEVVKNVGAIAFEAGADTTFATLQAAFLAISLNPDILKKAHEELDAVVGPHRLPNFDDQDSLDYVNAIAFEALRWHNVVPLGVPHKTIADDELGGYFIPAGTIVMANTWACMHDPTVFTDPDVFRPERYIREGKLDLSLRDPSMFAFGYGRRICPGRHFALSSLFLNVASVLHVFDITPALAEDGRPIHIKPTMTDGFLSYPEDCRCTIKPRSAAAEELIRFRATTAS